MALQQIANFRLIPAFVAKLDYMLMVAREQRKKISEPFKIDIPARRKLKEHRAQVLA
jgi:hypothetical protein